MDQAAAEQQVALVLDAAAASGQAVRAVVAYHRAVQLEIAAIENARAAIAAGRQPPALDGDVVE